MSISLSATLQQLIQQILPWKCIFLFPDSSNLSMNAIHPTLRNIKTTAATNDNDNKPIMDLIGERNAEQPSTAVGVTTRGKKWSNKVATGKKITSCDGKYCLMPEDNPVVVKNKCATCKKTCMSNAEY